MLTIRTTEKGIYVSVDGKQEMAHPLGSLRYTCTSTSVRFFPANGYEGLYEGRYGDNFTVNGEPVTKENAQTLLEALFFLKDEGGGETLKTINGIALPGAGNIVLNQYIQHYKWVSNVATTRKQVPAALRARDVKISYNNASGTYIVEQYQSDDISDAAWGDDANWKGFRTPMTPMLEEAGAVFNDETGLYRIDNDNGIYLDDLTEGEVLEAYSCRIPFSYANNALSYVGIKERPRIYFPIKIINSVSVTFPSGFQSNNKLQRIGIAANYPITLSSAFYGCSNLEQLHITSNTSVDINSLPFAACAKLYLLKIGKLKSNLEIPDSPLVTLDSLEYDVNNAVNASAVTWTVHPDVYAKLTDPDNTEWYAVNTAAQAKQIAFATTQVTRVALLSMNALPEVVNEGGELVAPAGYYITQAADTPTEERIFLTRKVLLPGEDTSSWRIATVAERQEQEDYFNTKLFEN